MWRQGGGQTCCSQRPRVTSLRCSSSILQEAPSQAGCGGEKFPRSLSVPIPFPPTSQNSFAAENSPRVLYIPCPKILRSKPKEYRVQFLVLLQGLEQGFGEQRLCPAFSQLRYYTPPQPAGVVRLWVLFAHRLLGSFRNTQEG